MDKALQALYELTINPFVAKGRVAPQVAATPPDVDPFERCEVCFDPGWDPLDPPPPDQPDPSLTVA